MPVAALLRAAAETGVGFGEAAATLRASEQLGELPDVEAAVRAGDLSGAQTREIADAATAENSSELLKTARQSGFDQLRKKCRQAKAARRTDADEQARHAKAHRERYHRSWTDSEGAYRYEGKCSAMDGAVIDAHIAAEADRVFKEAWKEGRRESQAAYRFDAFKRLVTLGGGGEDVAGGVTGSGTKTEVIIRVDATRLAGGDGLCETSTGPVPVHEAIGAILAGAFVKIVLRDGVDITKVAHHRRHIPA